MEYNNPNDYWQGYDTYKGMNDDERLRAGCMHGICVAVAVMIALVLCALFGSCASTRSSIDESHNISTRLERIDSLLQVRTVVQQDSTWREMVLRQFQSIRETSDTSHTLVVDTAGKVLKETIIINNTREKESETDSQEREVIMHRLEVMDSTLNIMQQQLSVSDSLLRVESQVKEVPAELTGWQRFRLSLANVLLYTLLIVGGVWALRRWLKR